MTFGQWKELGSRFFSRLLTLSRIPGRMQDLYCLRGKISGDRAEVAKRLTVGGDSDEG